MVQKRPFDQELDEISPKLPRHVEPDDQLASLGIPHLSGEDEEIPLKDKFTSDEKFDSGCAADVPGSASNSSWATSSTSEEDVKSDGPYHVLLSPERYNLDPPFRSISRSKLIYSSLVRSPPRKLVPLGPDFQAELPDFVGHEKKKTSCSEETHEADGTSQALESESNGHLNDEDRLAGTCTIPMPEVESAGHNDENVGNGAGDCLCEDAGSIRCVRQHVFEAREKLKTTLGEETFVKLGFYDMGEIVSLKWSEEDQELFHDIVFSNPASLGKNFWDHLAVEFPSKTKKQIVSYYFNVFMLRRRAEQNRFDPSNVDSDNDEWHAPEEFSGDEAKLTDEDEDSVVESPFYPDHSIGDIYRDSVLAYDDVRPPIWDYYNDVSYETNKPLGYASGECGDKALEKHSSEQTRNQGNDVPNQDRDGKCTVAAPKAHAKADISRDWSRGFMGMGSENGHDYALEPCNGKEWDVGFFSCPKSKVDLLPTCTMIEEVFGDKDWNFSSRDGHGQS